MMQRAQTPIAAALILGSALTGLLGLPFYSFLAIGLALSFLAVWRQEKLRGRFTAVGATNVLAMAHLASLADGCLVAAAAWGVGFAFRILLATFLS